MAVMTRIDPAWFSDEAIKRFYSRTELKESGCIEWMGARTTLGYGRVGVQGRYLLTHRVVLVIESGKDIDAGMVVDHLCRNPACLNSKHLEVVSFAENTARGVNHIASAARAHIDRNECGNGHDLAVSKRVVAGGGYRCHACERNNSAKKEAGRKSDPVFKEKKRLRMAAYRERLKETA